MRSDSQPSYYPCASGLGGVATVYIFLVFDKEGAGAEVKDGFGGPWYPGNVVRSSGFYGPKKRGHTSAHKCNWNRGTRTHIGSQHRGRRPGQRRGDCFLTRQWPRRNLIHVLVICTGLPVACGRGGLRQRTLTLPIEEQRNDDDGDRRYTSYGAASDGSRV